MKRYIVTLTGTIAVDTTVAVTAESEEQARRKALDGYEDDTTPWLHYESLLDEPVVSDVREEPQPELEFGPAAPPHALISDAVCREAPRELTTL